MMYPFTDEWSDYDDNGDGRISYEEFVFAVLRTVPLAEFDELREPFIVADLNGMYFLVHDKIVRLLIIFDQLMP